MAVGLIFLNSCKTGNCRSQNPYPAPAVASDVAPAKTLISTSPKVEGSANANSDINSKEKVKVFKYDGSKQCGQAESIPVDVMQKELGSIPVFLSENKADGLMHIAMCGAGTGRANVYLIERKDLDEAKKKGFKEWVFE